MNYLLVFLLVIGPKFLPDDPINRDNDTAVDVQAIASHKLSDYYDVLYQTLGKPGDSTKREAVNVNTLGEAPDSSWFRNRHGMFSMSREELARGPNTSDGPSPKNVWEVLRLKTEGITPGLSIRDANGDVYLIKFDSPRYAELTSAAEVISTKFLYAIGFNVPENYIAFFTRDQLRPGEGVTEAEVNDVLARVFRAPDGRYRAVASRLLKGVPVGPFKYSGARPDDPNDIYAHEDRRELRGLRVFSAWLNHTDTKASNSLDMLVNEGGSRYVRHYLIDFGSTLGSGGVGPQKPRYGWEYMVDAKSAVARVATFGLWDRKWVHVKYPHNPSIGRFESAQFEPRGWRPHYPNPAFQKLTPQDAYWAAKIVMSFSDEEIRSVVKSGQLSDPTVEAYIVKTLIERRDKIGRAWLTNVNAFDRFELTPDGELMFTYLASAYGFSEQPRFRLAWFRFDNGTGERERIDRLHPEQKGHFVAEISSREGVVDVYVRNLNGLPQIVGIER